MKQIFLEKNYNTKFLYLEKKEDKFSLEDILKKLGSLKKEGQTIIGFAAETHQVIEFAKQKLVKKNADFIIANNVSDQTIGFGSDMHQVTILSKNGDEILLPKVSKYLLAKEIWNHLVPNL